jgi:hypothetical protein
MRSMTENVAGLSVRDSMHLASRGTRRAGRGGAADAVLVCLVVAITHGSPALCATPAPTVRIDDPRPIDRALEYLQSKFGYVVTYEDPRYQYAGDVKDVSEDATARIRTLVPVGGAVSISLPATGRDSRALGSVLNQLLQSHAGLQRGGHFRLLEEGGVFHVVPAEVQDRSGNWQPQVPVLDSAITVPKLANADGVMMLNAICEAASNATGTPVFVGTVPLNILKQHRGDLEANSEVARAVLLRAFALSSPSLSWGLLYDAGLRTYFLNVRLIQAPTPPAVQPVATGVPPTK